MRILVLGVGNDIMGDDGAGLWVARYLKGRLPAQVDVRELMAGGIHLAESLAGYSHAVLVDSLLDVSGKPGEILEFSGVELGATRAVFPHQAGIAEALAMGKQAGLSMPEKVKVVAIRVTRAPVFGGSLSPEVEKAVPRAAARVKDIVEGWLEVISPERDRSRLRRRHSSG